MASKNGTRDRLLLAARRLVAARGVDGVAVRDILKAAGVRNGGAVHYYFGTKEDLLRELLAMGARVIDERRLSLLQAAQREPRPLTLEDMMSILVHSAIAVSKSPRGEDSYMRFAQRVRDTHPTLYDQAVQGRWDRGYRKAAELMRRLLPPLGQCEISERLMLVMEFLNTSLARREAFLVDGVGDARWASPQLPETLIAVTVRMLQAPP